MPRTGGLDPQDRPLFDPRDYDGFTFLREDCRTYFQRSQEPFDVVFHLAAMVGGRLMIDYEPLRLPRTSRSTLCIGAGPSRPRRARGLLLVERRLPDHLQRPEGYRLLKEDDIDFPKRWACLT